ncbi:hypothetical protein F5887DRAFT_942684 [Amanita rubescens]|nr:hypothetical protein F5887DRAFT_942684 [Amanita rubescens]
MSSPPILVPTGPSAHDLQSHLYLAFLQGKTADVALRIRGSWNAIYSLHRVVLIQSGFFRSLFTAGFSESLPRLHTHHSSSGPDQIDLVFDDCNITRAGQVCISRLYGGGPALYIPPSLIPSTTQPLSSSFYDGFTWGKRPDNQHPASPWFLLSLLATATFLSIPTVAAQALSCILSTIGPHTVVSYLKFALGDHIGPPDDTDLDAAVGLEHVAQLFDDCDDDKTDSSEDSHSDQPTSSDDILGLQVRKGNPIDSDGDKPGSASPVFYYGTVSDKIGEACACWLARWGSDMLDCEEILEGIHPNPSSNPIPPIWRRGGLSPKWIATLLAADTLFVRGECERYEVARRAVEIRRRSGILLAEEAEWSNVFEESIYYENMTMEDIIKISQDVSVTTKRTFVPLHVLQAALWRHSALRQRIMSASSTLSSRELSFEKELGITCTTSELDLTTSPEEAPSRSYFPVFEDSSSRLGDNGNLIDKSPSTMDELYDNLRNPSMSHPVSSSKSVLNKKRSFHALTPQTPLSDSSFFGLVPLRSTPSTCVQRDPAGRQKWSPYSPCRFAIEFWDLDFLKEKARLYSQTVWYAGSLFNVYVQIVKKREQIQLGIYLHRQSTVDPVPGASIPSPLMCSDTTPSDNSQDERRAHSNKSPTSSITLMPMTPPTSYTSPPIRATSDAASSLPSSPGRRATGSSQTRFRSSPDVFGISKSWGWKTSSLRTDEYMEVRDEAAGPRTTPYGSEFSLRATVVLGLV